MRKSKQTTTVDVGPAYTLDYLDIGYIIEFANEHGVRIAGRLSGVGVPANEDDQVVIALRDVPSVYLIPRDTVVTILLEDW